jgi:hypothetical protein
MDDIIVEFNEAAFRHDISKEEAIAISDYFINNKVTLGPNGSGWLSQREMRLLGLKNMTVNYLITKVKADNKSPVQIIDDLVGKEIAAST